MSLLIILLSDKAVRSLRLVRALVRPNTAVCKPNESVIDPKKEERGEALKILMLFLSIYLVIAFQVTTCLSRSQHNLERKFTELSNNRYGIFSLRK